MITITTKKPLISLNLDDSINLTFNAKKCFINEIMALNEGVEYDLKLTKHRTARTLTQNSFMWVLIGELAIKLKLGRNEVYKNYIRDYGVYTILPIKNELVERFIETWQSRGIGWFCDDTKSKLDGYTNVITYYGTSSYSKEEMERVLDAIIFDCNEYGIPVTMNYKEMEL